MPIKVTTHIISHSVRNTSQCRSILYWIVDDPRSRLLIGTESCVRLRPWRRSDIGKMWSSVIEKCIIKSVIGSVHHGILNIRRAFRRIPRFVNIAGGDLMGIVDDPRSRLLIGNESCVRLRPWRRSYIGKLWSSVIGKCIIKSVIGSVHHGILNIRMAFN